MSLGWDESARDAMAVLTAIADPRADSDPEGLLGELLDTPPSAAEQLAAMAALGRGFLKLAALLAVELGASTGRGTLQVLSELALRMESQPD